MLYIFELYLCVVDDMTLDPGARASFFLLMYLFCICVVFCGLLTRWLLVGVVALCRVSWSKAPAWTVDGWLVGGPSFFHLLDGWEAFLSQLGFRFGFEPGNGWSERRYCLVKRAFQEHGQPGFQRRWVQVIHCFHDKSMTGYQKCCVFVANDNENQKKCIFTERWRTLRP